MKTVRQILWIAKCQYRRFWNIKNVFLMICSVVFLGESIIHKMLEVSQETGLVLNYLEPVILVMSDAFYAMIIPITCLVLLSNFPDNSSSGIFMMVRVKRKNWLLGQLLYGICVCSTYMIALFAGSILWIGKYGEFSLTWSTFMTEIRNSFPEIYAISTEVFIPSSTLTQGTPLQVFLISMGLMLLYMLTFSQILCAFKLVNRKKTGMVVCVAVTIIGAALISAVGNYKWLIPMAHAIFGLHFREFYAQSECRILWSVIYFLIWNAVLLIINGYLMRKCQIGDERE